MTASDRITFDLDDLTIDEIDMLEETLDGPFDAMFARGKRRGPTMRAVAWIVRRRDDPSFTLEQAGALKLSLASNEESPTVASAE